MDKYKSFSDLSEVEKEGIDFDIITLERENSPTAIIAPHGGGIEPGTSEIARKIANDDLSLAIFEGKKSSGNSSLHITSTNFDEPRCLSLIIKKKYIVSIHGEQSSKSVVFIGGKDETLKMAIQLSLHRKGYNVQVHQNKNLQGMHHLNICNCGLRKKGVQLEISNGLRQQFFESLNSRGRTKTKNDLAEFTGSIRDGLKTIGAL